MRPLLTLLLLTLFIVAVCGGKNHERWGLYDADFTQYINHYRELNCTPYYDRDNLVFQCNIGYDRSFCRYRNKLYRISEVLGEKDLIGECFQCTCTNVGKNNVGFICTDRSCTGYMDHLDTITDWHIDDVNRLREILNREDVMRNDKTDEDVSREHQLTKKDMKKIKKIYKKQFNKDFDEDTMEDDTRNKMKTQSDVDSLEFHLTKKDIKKIKKIFKKQFKTHSEETVDNDDIVKKKMTTQDNLFKKQFKAYSVEDSSEKGQIINDATDTHNNYWNRKYVDRDTNMNNNHDEMRDRYLDSSEEMTGIRNYMVNNINSDSRDTSDDLYDTTKNYRNDWTNKFHMHHHRHRRDIRDIWSREMTTEKEQCIDQYVTDKCCSVNRICGDDIRKLKRCYVDGRIYLAGQRFTKDCQKCVCDNSGFVNCKKRSCETDLRFLFEARFNCAPIYDKENQCCPVSWKCPIKKDYKIVKMNKNVKTTTDTKCKYGTESLLLGDRVIVWDHCMNCQCQVPPFVTCINMCKTPFLERKH